MTSLCSELLSALEGKTLVTAESITGGSIGAALTGISGSSRVYKGGVISYCDGVKAQILQVPPKLLTKLGAVSAPVAEHMALGVRKLMEADYAISVTGLAGPGGDDFGNDVGTVFIGLAWEQGCVVQEFHFTGNRESVRRQTLRAALELALEYFKKGD